MNEAAGLLPPTQIRDSYPSRYPSVVLAESWLLGFFESAHGRSVLLEKMLAVKELLVEESQLLSLRADVKLRLRTCSRACVRILNLPPHLAVDSAERALRLTPITAAGMMKWILRGAGNDRSKSLLSQGIVAELAAAFAPAELSVDEAQFSYAYAPKMERSLSCLLDQNTAYLKRLWDDLYARAERSLVEVFCTTAERSLYSQLMAQLSGELPPARNRLNRVDWLRRFSGRRSSWREAGCDAGLISRTLDSFERTLRKGEKLESEAESSTDTHRRCADGEIFTTIFERIDSLPLSHPGRVDLMSRLLKLGVEAQLSKKQLRLLSRRLEAERELLTWWSGAHAVLAVRSILYHKSPFRFKNGIRLARLSQSLFEERAVQLRRLHNLRGTSHHLDHTPLCSEGVGRLITFCVESRLVRLLSGDLEEVVKAYCHAEVVRPHVAKGLGFPNWGGRCGKVNRASFERVFRGLLKDREFLAMYRGDNEHQRNEHFIYFLTDMMVGRLAASRIKSSSRHTKANRALLRVVAP